ncbi:MAG: hypothetical protein P8Z79_05415 [Sedimentisphaerales bacterium]
MSALRRGPRIALIVLLCCSSSAIAEELSVGNASISIGLNTADGTLSVTDKRIPCTWQQRVLTRGQVTQAERVAGGIDMTWRQPGFDMDVRVRVRLDEEQPEFTLELSAQDNLKGSLGFPHPFVTEPGTYLVVPMNEGISYPVDDESIRPRWLVAYGGHGICMAFWGVTDGHRGHMAIIETPDDASIYINRIEDRLCIAPKWQPQKAAFGYSRKLRYVFFDRGGYVAICKRYRSYAKQIGRFKTLAQKRNENPNVDLLIGAVNVWCWERDALSLVRQMNSLGIERLR